MRRRVWGWSGGIGLVVLAAAYVGSAWYFGYETQKRMVVWVSQANEAIDSQWSSPDPRPEVSIESYRRGILTSDIRYAVSFTDENGRLARVQIRNHLEHGPWPLAALRAHVWRPVMGYSQLSPLPGKVWQAWFDAVPGDAPPWTIGSRIDFDGMMVSDGIFQPVRWNQQVDFSGGRIHLRYDSVSLHMKWTADFKGLSVTDPDGHERVELHDVVLKGSHTLTGNSDMQSHQSLHCGEALLSRRYWPELAFRGAVFRVDTARTGDLADSRLQYDLGRLFVDQHDLGRIKAVVSIQQISVPALRELLSVLQAQAHPDGSFVDAPEEQRTGKAIAAVLATAPRLSLDTLSWSNARGRSDVKVGADFQPAGDQGWRDLSAVLQHAVRQLQLHARVSKPMVLETLRRAQAGDERQVSLFSMLFDQYVRRWVEAGLVSRDDQEVSADWTYMDGVLDVGGTHMSPAQLSSKLEAVLGVH